MGKYGRGGPQNEGNWGGLNLSGTEEGMYRVLYMWGKNVQRIPSWAHVKNTQENMQCAKESDWG